MLAPMKPIKPIKTISLLLLACTFLASSQQAPQEPRGDQQIHLQQEIHHKEGGPRGMCVPMLDLAPHLTNSQQRQQSTFDPSATLTFDVGNILVPVAPTAGSIHSAMKILSSFDSQLFSDANEEQESGGNQRDQEDQESEDGGQEEGPVENVAKFRQNKLHIQGLNLTMLNIHLYTQSEPKFALGVSIRNTTISGRFVFNGPMLISGTDSKLVGQYRMSIENILATASANLTKILQTPSRSSPRLDLKSNAALVGQPTAPPSGGALNHAPRRLVTNDFKMNITNLGYISIDILDARDPTKPTSSYLLKMLQRILQKTIKRTYYSFEDYIRRTLELEGRRFLDCELSRFSPLLGPVSPTVQLLQPQQSAGNHLAPAQAPALAVAGNSTGGAILSASNQLDLDLARIINSEIANSNLSRVSLPNFEYQRSLFGANATIHFVNGSLSGLDHLRLNGETKIKLQNEHLLINASLGWHDLRPHYNWSLFLGSSNQPTPGGDSTRAPTTKGFVAFNIKLVDFDAVISKGLRVGARLTVEQLLIRRLEGLRMDFGGLPGVNRLTRGLVNFFMGRLKQRLVVSIEPALKEQLERSLNRLAMFSGGER